MDLEAETKIIESFEIRTDVICNHYKGHENILIREVLAEFLLYEGKTERTANLYRDMINRHKLHLWIEKLPDKDEWVKNGFVTAPCAWEMKRQLEEYHDTTDAPVFNHNIYHFYAHTYPHIPPQTAAILNQRVEINLESARGHFKLFFNYIFDKTNNPALFLSYHLKKTFKANLKSYRLFLLEVVEARKKIGLGKKFIKEWLSQQKQKKETVLTHREEMIKLHYLKESGHISSLPTPTELRKKYGQNRYKASLSLSKAKKNSSKYKPPKLLEIENVLSDLKNNNLESACALAEKELALLKQNS